MTVLVFLLVCFAVTTAIILDLEDQPMLYAWCAVCLALGAALPTIVVRCLAMF